MFYDHHLPTINALSMVWNDCMYSVSTKFFTESFQKEGEKYRDSSGLCQWSLAIILNFPYSRNTFWLGKDKKYRFEWL